MTTQAFIERLVTQGVEFWMDEKEVVYDGPDDVLTDDAIRELWRCRGEIESWLAAHDRQSQVIAAPVSATSEMSGRRCRQHVDPADWIDEPPVAGRIRTHCRRCYGFIGYRAVDRS